MILISPCGGDDSMAETNRNSQNNSSISYPTTPPTTPPSLRAAHMSIRSGPRTWPSSCSGYLYLQCPPLLVRTCNYADERLASMHLLAALRAHVCIFNRLPTSPFRLDPGAYSTCDGLGYYDTALALSGLALNPSV